MVRPATEAVRPSVCGAVAVVAALEARWIVVFARDDDFQGAEDYVPGRGDRSLGVSLLMAEIYQYTGLAA
jgi:hypothetical protein